jgi:hypothetical protein
MTTLIISAQRASEGLGAPVRGHTESPRCERSSIGLLIMIDRASITTSVDGLGPQA